MYIYIQLEDIMATAATSIAAFNGCRCRRHRLPLLSLSLTRPLSRLVCRRCHCPPLPSFPCHHCRCPLGSCFSLALSFDHYLSHSPSHSATLLLLCLYQITQFLLAWKSIPTSHKKMNSSKSEKRKSREPK